MIVILCFSLKGSKHSLVGDKEMHHSHHMDMVSSSSMKLSVDPVCQNVTYSQERDARGAPNEDSTIKRLPTKVDSANNSTQTWADRLPQADTRDKSAVTVLSASKLRLLHDTTMIDTALDLDSLDGSTVSLWPANV